jgi:predicted ATPase/DNA-binding CsgD family transcriptional regulator
MTKLDGAQAPGMGASPANTLEAFTQRFPDDEACLEFLWKLRGAADGVHAFCRRCQRMCRFQRYDTKQARRSWTCTRCGTHVHPTAGTVFEGSSIGLYRWFLAIHVLLSTNSAVSAKDLQRQLGVGYRAARTMKSALVEALADLGGRPQRGLSAEQLLATAVRRCALRVDRTRPGAWTETGASGSSNPDRPAGPAPRAAASGLPVYLDEFVGRDGEAARLRMLLQRERLVTVTGAGGCGKTRLAAVVASNPAGQPGEGVAWVDLATIGDSSSVAVTVADALGLYEQPHRNPLDALIEQLRERSVLVVLDNCEHVLEGCAQVVVALLSHCPRVRLLATSREQLGMSSETVWRLPSLAVPDVATEASPRALIAFDSVALFVDRATAARPSFAMTEANAAAVAQLCRELDGIPLAIELAAARVGVLTVEQIGRAVRDSIALLSTGRASVPRHRTLHASLKWSYDLLLDSEQVVLRRLAIFPVSFSPEAARAVCVDDALSADDVLEIIFRLVDKSLVVVEEHGLRYRYRLLHVVRGYAIARLAEAGDEAATRGRHLDHAVTFVEEATVLLPTAAQTEWLDLLDVERANLWTALDWSIRVGQRATSLRLANGLGLYFVIRGRTLEGQRWFAAALDADSPPTASAARARALWAAAFIDVNGFDAPAAEAKAAAALEMAVAFGDQQTAARAQDLLGLIELNTTPVQARIRLRDAVSAAREAGDEWCVCHASQLIAWSWMTQGALTPAQQAIDVAFSFVQPTGNYFFLAWHWLCVAQLSRRRGDLAAAEDAAVRAQAYARAAGDPLCQAWAAMCEADITCLRGDATVARSALRRLDAHHNLSAASPATATMFHTAYGKCALARGDITEAELQLQAAAGLARNAHNLGVQGECLVELASIAVSRGDRALAQGLVDELTDCARSLDNAWMSSAAVTVQAQLARADGDADTARRLAYQALVAHAEHGYQRDLLIVLELIADLYVDRQMYREATRLDGAISAARRRMGIRWLSVDDAGRQAGRSRAARAVESGERGRLLAAGAALGLDDVVRYVSRGRGARDRPTTGWESLTPTEQTMVRLVAAGHTNSDIAEKMMISPATVKAHLTHIFTKTGVTRRAELAAEATRRSI